MKLLDMVLVAEENGYSKRDVWEVECKVTPTGKTIDLGFKWIEDKEKYFHFYRHGVKLLCIKQTGNIYQGTKSYVLMRDVDVAATMRVNGSIDKIIAAFNA